MHHIKPVLLEFPRRNPRASPLKTPAIIPDQRRFSNARLTRHQDQSGHSFGSHQSPFYVPSIESISELQSTRPITRTNRKVTDFSLCFFPKAPFQIIRQRLRGLVAIFRRLLKQPIQNPADD